MLVPTLLISSTLKSVCIQKLLIVGLSGHGDARVSHRGLHLGILDARIVAELATAEIRCNEADNQRDELADEELVNEVGIVRVGPVLVIGRGRGCLRECQTKSCQLTLLTMPVSIRHYDGREQEDGQEMMAEDANHPGAIDPASQDEEYGVNRHEDEREAGK